MDEILNFENIIKLFLSLRQVEIFSCRWMSTSALVTVMKQVYNLDDNGLILTSQTLNGVLTSRRKELKSIFTDHLNFCVPGMIGRTIHYKNGIAEYAYCFQIPEVNQNKRARSGTTGSTGRRLSRRSASDNGNTQYQSLPPIPDDVTRMGDVSEILKILQKEEFRIYIHDVLGTGWTTKGTKESNSCSKTKKRKSDSDRTSKSPPAINSHENKSGFISTSMDLSLKPIWECQTA